MMYLWISSLENSIFRKFCHIWWRINPKCLSRPNNKQKDEKFNWLHHIFQRQGFKHYVHPSKVYLVKSQFSIFCWTCCFVCILRHRVDIWCLLQCLAGKVEYESIESSSFDFYRTRVRSLAMLVSDSCLVNLMALNDTNYAKYLSNIWHFWLCLSLTQWLTQ